MVFSPEDQVKCIFGFITTRSVTKLNSLQQIENIKNFPAGSVGIKYTSIKLYTKWVSTKLFFPNEMNGLILTATKHNTINLKNTTKTTLSISIIFPSLPFPSIKGSSWFLRLIYKHKNRVTETFGISHLFKGENHKFCFLCMKVGLPHFNI